MVGKMLWALGALVAAGSVAADEPLFRRENETTPALAPEVEGYCRTKTVTCYETKTVCGYNCDKTYVLLYHLPL
jgi:hypothetical protein